MGGVVRRYFYIDILILHIPTALVLAIFCSCIPSLLLCSFKNYFHLKITKGMQIMYKFEKSFTCVLHTSSM